VEITSDTCLMSLVIPTVIPMDVKGNCGIDARVQSIREMRLRPLTERPSILEYFGVFWSILEYFGVIYLDLVSNPIACVYTVHQPLDAAGTDKADIDDLHRIQ
jgi:hypothetical protein